MIPFDKMFDRYLLNIKVFQFFLPTSPWVQVKSPPRQVAHFSGQLAHFSGQLTHCSGQLAHCSGQLAHSPGLLEKLIFCVLLM
jgi:hypothetical protein